MTYFTKISCLSIIIISALFLPFVASAHPGNTDVYGCHTCRTNCPKWGLDTGEYHCHNAKALPQPLPPVTSHSNGVTEPAPQYVKPVVKPVVKPAPVVKKPVVKTVPVIKPVVQPTQKPAKKPLEKPVVKSVTKPNVKPTVKSEPKKVTKPITTSTPVIGQKSISPVPIKESWWSKIKKWF